jgi:hypothetical protein
MLGFHMARLAKADEIAKFVRFICGRKKPKRFYMMNTQLFPYLRFGFAADTAGEIVPFSRQVPLVLPERVNTAALGKGAVMEVPVFRWIAAIVAFQSIAHFFTGFRRTGFILPRASFFLRSQQGTARSRACYSFFDLGSFYVERFTAVLAMQFDLGGETFMRTEPGITSSLVNEERFTAGLAGAFNLLASAFRPTFSTAKFLIRFWFRDDKFVSASGALSCAHRCIITQFACLW